MTETIERTPGVGEVATTRSFGPLTRSHFVRYAGAGGDFNPIHHDETFAVRAGYPSVFGHGLLTAGLLSTFTADWLGQSRLRRFSVRYADQVWPGEVLVMSGTVVSAEPTADGILVKCELFVNAGPDESNLRLVLRGGAEALFPAAQGSES